MVGEEPWLWVGVHRIYPNLSHNVTHVYSSPLIHLCRGALQVSKHHLVMSLISKTVTHPKLELRTDHLDRSQRATIESRLHPHDPPDAQLPYAPYRSVSSHDAGCLLCRRPDHASDWLLHGQLGAFTD